jgi:peptidoglycan/xylan/chitin deacetylase (PgdA/CDA1 family)
LAIGRPLTTLVAGAAMAAWLPVLSGASALPACVLSAALLGLLALGSFWARSGVYGRVLLSGPPDSQPPRVALTFDDGPDPQTTPQVLAVLAQHGVRATFFVIGERAQRHPRLLAEMAAAGHQIENHSLRHAWTTAFADAKQLRAELEQTQQIIAAATGRRPTWFRPPIGILSPPVAQAAAALGLHLAGWSSKARDGWASTQLGDALTRLRRALRPGAILLLHDAPERPATSAVTPLSVPILRALLPELKARGLHPVPLDELSGGERSGAAARSPGSPRRG